MRHHVPYICNIYAIYMRCISLHVNVMTMMSMIMKILITMMMIITMMVMIDYVDYGYDDDGDDHSFIHSGLFYSSPSSPLLLRGAPNYSTDTVFTPKHTGKCR